MRKGSLIQQARRRNLWTQPDLAEKLGIAWKYLAIVEQRRVVPSRRLMAAWSEVLGGKVEDFFDPDNGLAL